MFFATVYPSPLRKDSVFLKSKLLTDAEEALEALAEFSGKRVRDDLVATIFSRFCVGK